METNRKLETQFVPHPIEEAVWKAGLRAAKANLGPGLVIQVMLIVLLVSYYSVAGVRETLDRLGRFKTENDLLFVLCGSVIAGAILPELLKILVLQRGRATWQNWKTLRFHMPYWLIMGSIVEVLYVLQNHWFGHGNDWSTVTKKVLFDQFVFSPFFANTATVVVYELRGRKWDFGAFKDMANARFARQRVIPLVIASWAVWIPVVSVVYAMPAPLQFPIFSLVLSFWSLMMAMIASGK